jgi:hypothetical protein
MKLQILYYTGTGNSLWTAQQISKNFDKVELYSITKEITHVDKKADIIGFVFPVYIWGVPTRVVKFIEQLQIDKGKYYFAVAVNAGQVAKTLVQFKKLLKRKGIKLNSGFKLTMPSNYIPWGGPGSIESQEEKLKIATNKINKFTKMIKDKKTLPVEKGPLHHNIFFSIFYKLTYKQVPKMDNKFWADNKCNKYALLII